MWTLYLSYKQLQIHIAHLKPGSNESQSLQFLKEWCDSLALECCSGVCLVTDRDGQRVYRLFHQMREHEHDNFEGKLADLGVWAAQCTTGNLSAGKYFAIAPSSRGTTEAKYNFDYCCVQLFPKLDENVCTCGIIHPVFCTSYRQSDTSSQL